MELHERIYQLRRQKNMTQQDLADKLGVSRQAVSRWEMGTAKPELDSMAEMAKIFGLTLDELVTGEAAAAEKVPAAAENQKKPGDRFWWIVWAVSVAVTLAVAVITTVVDHQSNPHSFVTVSPMTLAAQVINLALILGILVLIIRWLCRRGK